MATALAATLSAALIAGGAALAGGAWAEPAPGGEAAFRQADADKDGRLSKGEAAALPAIAARFEELDRDKDGHLSLEEFLTGYTA